MGLFDDPWRTLTGVATGGLSEVVREDGVVRDVLGDVPVVGELFSPPPRITEADVRQPQALDYSGLEEEKRRARARGDVLSAYATDALGTGRPMPQAQAASIDRSKLFPGLVAQGQSRGHQTEQIDRLTNAAEGRTASAAEIQQQQGIDQAIAAQAGLANSARGGAAASVAAQRGAAQQGARLGLEGTRDAAVLRAQEQAAARQALTSAITQQRAGDMGMLQHQARLEQAEAGLQQQANLLNPRLSIQSRQADDARALGLLGAEMDRTELAGNAELKKLQLQQELQKMLLKRDLGIAGANLEAEHMDRAGKFGILSAGAETFATGGLS